MSQTYPPNSFKVLSLYRSLLREATYLPDEAAQSHFRRWIAHRFHSASTSADPEGPFKARKALRRLERANSGDSKALTWVLDNTYGRIGKRRRELVNDLRAHADEPLIPKDDSEVKRLLRKSRTQKPPGGDEPPPVKTKLQALITSHARTAPPPLTPRTQIKKDKPNIPDTNIWGRPTALKLRAGMERRWWATTLDSLLPPLPPHEHERLHNLAMGITPFPGIPSRRASKTQPKQTELISSREMARYLQPISHVEKIPMKERYGNHKITGRFMKRLWMRILTLSPVMTRDEVRNTWEIQWVGVKTLPITSVVTTASIADMELFEGSEAVVISKKGKRNKRLLAKVPEDREQLRSAG